MASLLRNPEQCISFSVWLMIKVEATKLGFRSKTFSLRKTDPMTSPR